ncbi:single-stranded DNA-binding protein [Mucilaginibacter sp. Bleaf8]|uniref:single-stranded DNA-binding protein n=1 Tax=Mucilaginibacter sp. Bleaf8 TaxID=2834430 RepID=UPI001BCC6C75|nr:single-stranded DNA-binding protein [Mucilaginibacter sp. Bleaf8]MBS7565032.1 single-stranded DNA-binding protein [Mucilaginibacter sp. Bleaf8]
MFNNAGINKVFLVGHVGKTPRMHSQPDGQSFFCFPLVTTEFIKKDGQNTEHIEWHQIKVPTNFDAVESLDKGQLIYLEGKIKTRSFVDEAGIKRYKAEIVVLSFKVLSAQATTIPVYQPLGQAV